MLRIVIAVLFIFIFGTVSFCYSQDSTKKTNPAHTIRKPYATKATFVKTDSSVALPVDKSLKGQYLFLLTKIYHYQQPFLYPFWKNASDTLKLYRQLQKTANSKLTLQNKIIDSLKSQITKKDEALAEKIEEVNVLGVQMSLTAYNLIVWGMVIIFAIIAMIVVSSSASYRGEAKYRSNLYSDLEDEFKTFKTKANEREKKLARELQTERNKLDELMGGGEDDNI